MAKTVEVRLEERSYPIHIGRGVALGQVLEETDGRRALLVTDSNVEPLHGAAAQAAFEARGLACVRVAVPAGEATKDLHWVGELYARAATEKLDRSSLVIALGGGMIRGGYLPARREFHAGAHDTAGHGR